VEAQISWPGIEKGITDTAWSTIGKITEAMGVRVEYFTADVLLGAKKGKTSRGTGPVWLSLDFLAVRSARSENNTTLVELK